MSNFGEKIIGIQISDHSDTPYVVGDDYTFTFENIRTQSTLQSVLDGAHRSRRLYCKAFYFFYCILLWLLIWLPSIHFIQITFDTNKHTINITNFIHFTWIFFGRQQCTQSKYLTVDMLLKFQIIIWPLHINWRVRNRKLHHFFFFSFFYYFLYRFIFHFSYTFIQSFFALHSSNMIAIA